MYVIRAFREHRSPPMDKYTTTAYTDEGPVPVGCMPQLDPPRDLRRLAIWEEQQAKKKRKEMEAMIVGLKQTQATPETSEATMAPSTSSAAMKPGSRPSKKARDKLKKRDEDASEDPSKEERLVAPLEYTAGKP